MGGLCIDSSGGVSSVIRDGPSARAGPECKVYL